MQNMGIIDGNKKSKDGKLSQFVSQAVCDKVVHLKCDDVHSINVELLTMELNTLQRQRDAIEKRMLVIAEEISQEKRLICKEGNNGL